MICGFEGRVNIPLVSGIGKKRHLSKIRSMFFFSRLPVEGHGIPQRSAAGCFTSCWKIGHGS